MVCYVPYTPVPCRVVLPSDSSLQPRAQSRESSEEACNVVTGDMTSAAEGTPAKSPLQPSLQGLSGFSHALLLFATSAATCLSLVDFVLHVWLTSHVLRTLNLSPSE